MKVSCWTGQLLFLQAAFGCLHRCHCGLLVNSGWISVACVVSLMDYLIWKIQGFAGFDFLTGSKALMRVFFFPCQTQLSLCQVSNIQPFTGHRTSHNRSEVKACRCLGIPGGSRLDVKKTEDLTTVCLQEACRSLKTSADVQKRALHLL